MNFSSFIQANDLVNRARTLWGLGNQLLSELGEISPEVLQAMQMGGASLEELQAIQGAADAILPALGALRANPVLMAVLEPGYSVENIEE